LLEETTILFVTATPPTVTAVLLAKLLPVIVIAVPPAVGPKDGLKPKSVYVNVFAVTEEPSVVVTITGCAPTIPGGDTAVTLVAETATTLVAGAPPMVTPVVLANNVPVMENGVPPKRIPVAGATVVMVGMALVA